MTKMIDRINKLLAQAEGTHSEHEAAEAMKKAYELMAAHAISELDLQASGEVEQSRVENRQFKVANPYAQARLQLLGGIALRLSARVYYAPDRRHKTRNNIREHHVNAHIVGFPEDIELVIALYASLSKQMDQAMSDAYEMWLSLQPFPPTLGDKKIWKRSFMRGFATRISQRLKEQYVGEIEKAGHGLALRSKKERVNDEFSKLNLGKASTSQRSDWSGSAAGAQAGSSAVINRSIGG